MRIGAIALMCMLAACGDDGASPADAPPGDTTMDDGAVDGPNLMPMTLAETGLCNDGPCAVINPGILAYAPQYQLYSDGATKRRWIQIPAGTKIDTTDMNFWKFPVGTKVWKEFTRDGVRVETRFIMKVGADDALNDSWFWASYIWNTTQDASTYYDPSAGNMNANGTEHDVPSRSQCRRCHQNTPGRILGVNALSLDYTSTTVDLADLVGMDLLTTPPTAPSNGPYFPLPGTTAEKAAFGFFHANCGGCHNTESTVHDTVNIELRMDVTKLGSVAMMPAHATTVGIAAQLSTVPGTLVILGDADNSVLVQRVESLIAGVKMPELGTETLNTDGIAQVRAWIEP